MSNTNRDPTPDEIAEVCLQIQSTWSPDERLRRLRADERPHVSTCDGRTLPVTAEALAASTTRPVDEQAVETAQCVANKVQDAAQAYRCTL